MVRRKRKTKNHLAIALKYIFIGLYWVIKNIILGIWWFIKYLFNQIKPLIERVYKTDFKKKRTIKENKDLKISDTPSYKYEDFKIIKDLEGKYSNFEKKLMESKSGIGIILGARGAGKSAIGLKILENFYIKTQRPSYTMGFKESDLPEWIKNISSIDEVENNAVVLLDESGIQFSSRDSMSSINKLLSKLLLIARHKDLNLIFITQNSSNIDLNIIRQADYLILKPSSLLQKDFERKKINQIYNEVEIYFKQYKKEKGLTYIYAESYRGFVSNPLPSFWNTDISKAYRD